MSRIRLESHGRSCLLFLSFCLLAVLIAVPASGTPPLHPVFEFHDEHGGEQGAAPWEDSGAPVSPPSSPPCSS